MSTLHPPDLASPEGQPPASLAQPQPRLRARRMRWPDALTACSDGTALGAIGCTGPGAEAALLGLPATSLLDDIPRADAWIGTGPVTAGRSGPVQWRHDGHFMFGTLCVDEAGAGDLAQATRAAYKHVFACLRETGMPALLRVWNYLPRINEDAPAGLAGGGALERYRRFNAGRQQAFLEAGASAFDGAPAACALGTRAGPLCISFLAGQRATLAIENPRQVPAYRYPERYGPKSPSFSRAALCDAGDGEAALFISGTSSIVGHESRHPGDVVAQTHETLTNLHAVIAAANQRGSARFALDSMHCTVYLRHAADAATVQALLRAQLDPDAVALREASYVEADICRQELRVEIEAHGFAAGEVGA